MKNIKKLIVLLMLALIILPIANVMSAIPQEEENKTINLEYSIFQEDGTQIVKEITVDKNDIDTFNKIIPQIFEIITSTNNCTIIDLINQLKEKFGENKILSIITKILGIRPLQKRVLILSNGYGPKFDIRLKRDISIHKIFTLWYYTSTISGTIKSKTIIIDPIPDAKLQFYRLIEGQQIGLMTIFTGFYIRIPSKLMEQKQSHIFFIGYAAKVRTFDLPDIIE